MKKFVLMMFLLLTLALPVHAANTITFLWDANSESTLDGYILYESGVDGGMYYTNSIYFLTDLADASNPSCTIPEPAIKTYYVLTAFDINGVESDYSDVVSYDPTAYANGPGDEVVITLNPPTGLQVSKDQEAAL